MLFPRNSRRTWLWLVLEGERAGEINIVWIAAENGNMIRWRRVLKGCDSTGEKRTWSIYRQDELWHKIRSDSAVLLEDECHSAIQVPGGRWVKAEERRGRQDSLKYRLWYFHFWKVFTVQSFPAKWNFSERHFVSEGITTVWEHAKTCGA